MPFFLATLAACQRADDTTGPPPTPAAASDAAATASTPSPSATAGTPTPVATQTGWQCGDQRVAARFDPVTRTVTVTHDRGQLVLAQAEAASGARYADANGNEFWTKGASGTLTLSGTPPRECSEVAAGG